MVGERVGRHTDHASAAFRENAEYEYAVSGIIFEAYQQNRFLLEGDTLSDGEKNYFKGISPGMDREIAVNAVNALSGFLSRYYKKNVLCREGKNEYRTYYWH